MMLRAPLIFAVIRRRPIIVSVLAGLCLVLTPSETGAGPADKDYDRIVADRPLWRDTGSVPGGRDTTTLAYAYPPYYETEPPAYREAYNTGWQLYVDNDVFVKPDQDSDYTGGVAVAYTGRRVREWAFSVDSWLAAVDRLTGFGDFQNVDGGFARHAVEYGLVVFTPEDITQQSPIYDDRPYANFAFMANSRQVTFPDKRWLLQSALTVGVLGTDIGAEAQSLIHDATDGTEPRGWDNQISDGGEPSGKYSVMAQKNLIRYHGDASFELSAGIEGNLGMNTNAALNLNMRFGNLKSPWWSFVPHQAEYINLGQTITSRVDKRVMPAEWFVWAGLKVKRRLYNAFLQGQFRDSPVEFDGDRLEDVIHEAQLGITKTWNNGFGLSFVIRRRSNEITGPNGRDPVWSGFVVSFKG